MKRNRIVSLLAGALAMASWTTVHAMPVASFSGRGAIMTDHTYNGLTDMTLEAWIRTDKPPAPGYGGIAGEGYLGAYDGFGLYTIPDGRIGFQTRMDYVGTSAPYSFDGRWHHVAGVRAGDDTILYLDGIEVGRATGKVYMISPSWSFRIGSAGGNSFFDGEISDVRLWNVARTAAEIAGMRTARLSGEEPGLIGYWPLDDGEGKTARDLTSGGHDGTLGSVGWTIMDENPFLGDDGLVIAIDSLIRPETTPAVGVMAGLTAGDSVPLQAAAAYAGTRSRYRCIGYSIERNRIAAPGVVVTNLGVTSFDYLHDGRQARVTWLYEADGFRLDASCEAKSGGSLMIEPPPDLPGGYYSAGTSVTLTAKPSEGSIFAAWHGDFEGDGFSPTTTVTMDHPRVISYQTGWVYADGLLSDGNWVFEVTEKGDELSIKSTREVVDSQTLDFRPPIRDRSGSPYKLVSFGAGCCLGRAGLEAVYLPETVRTLGENCFNGCADLETVEPFLPASLTSIGHYVFYQCNKLGGDLVLSNPQFSALTYYAFSKTAVTSVDMRGSGVTALGEYWYGENCSFRDCTSLTNVFLPEDIEIIGKSAFNGCLNLQQVTPFLPATVRHVGRFAFLNCLKLRGDLVLSSPLMTNLYYYTFVGTDITSLDMGRSGVKKMPSAENNENCCFFNCRSLTNVILPSALEQIGTGAFLDCKNLERVVPAFPETVTAVGDYAFRGCRKLAGEVVLSNRGFTHLGSDVFRGTAITKCDLSKTSIQTMGTGNWSLNCAFGDCLSLREVYLPPDLPEVGQGLFWNCDGLESVYFRGKPPVLLRPEVFRYVPAYTACLYYPKQNAEWEIFGSTNFVALTDAEVQLFQKKHPGERLPVGTWCFTNSEKQWVGRWLPPEEALKATMLLLR